MCWQIRGKVQFRVFNVTALAKGGVVHLYTFVQLEQPVLFFFFNLQLMCDPLGFYRQASFMRRL